MARSGRLAGRLARSGLAAASLLLTQMPGRAQDYSGQGYSGQGYSGQGYTGQGYTGQGYSTPDDRVPRYQRRDDIDDRPPPRYRDDDRPPPPRYDRRDDPDDRPPPRYRSRDDIDDRPPPPRHREEDRPPPPRYERREEADERSPGRRTRDVRSEPAERTPRRMMCAIDDSEKRCRATAGRAGTACRCGKSRGRREASE